MIYLLYLLLAILTVGFSVRLSHYVDLLDSKTHLSGAFIGGVLLAAVTSLPEMFTSLTAVLGLDKPNLVLGNILGSNIFNFAILGVLLVFFTKIYQKSKIAKSHRTTLFFTIIMYLLVLGGINFNYNLKIGFINCNIFTLLILVAYGISVYKMGSDSTGEAEAKLVSDLSVSQIVLRFIIYSILLVLTSIVLTDVSDRVNVELGLGTTVGGAILLGIATSLPELSASFSLVKMGNFNASVGNVVGSCCFNFIILSVTDLLYNKHGLFAGGMSALPFVICGIISAILTYIALKFQKNKALVILCGVGIVVSYVASIALTM